MSAEINLAGIRARAEAATPGPWFVERVGEINDKTASIACIRWRGYVNTASFDDDFATAEHIAGMDPVTTLALVDEVERLRAAVPSATAALREMQAEILNSFGWMSESDKGRAMRMIERRADLIADAVSEATS